MIMKLYNRLRKKFEGIFQAKPKNVLGRNPQ